MRRTSPILSARARVEMSAAALSPATQSLQPRSLDMGLMAGDGSIDVDAWSRGASQRVGSGFAQLEQRHRVSFSPSRSTRTRGQTPAKTPYILSPAMRSLTMSPAGVHTLNRALHCPPPSRVALSALPFPAYFGLGGRVVELLCLHACT